MVAINLSFLLLSGIILSCDGAAHLPRTKRTVELIEGAKDFILRCDSLSDLSFSSELLLATRMAEINATPGRLVWVQVNDENYKGYANEGLFWKLVGNVFAS